MSEWSRSPEVVYPPVEATEELKGVGIIDAILQPPISKDVLSSTGLVYASVQAAHEETNYDPKIIIMADADDGGSEKYFPIHFEHGQPYAVSTTRGHHEDARALLSPEQTRAIDDLLWRSAEQA